MVFGLPMVGQLCILRFVGMILVDCRGWFGRRSITLTWRATFIEILLTLAFVLLRLLVIRLCGMGLLRWVGCWAMLTLCRDVALRRSVLSWVWTCRRL